MKALWHLALAASVLLVACGAAGGPGALTEGELAERVLAREDLPKEWADFTDEPGDAADDCGLNLLSDDPAATKSVAFEREGAALVEILGSFDSEERAHDAFEQLEQSLPDCIRSSEDHIEIRTSDIDNAGERSTLLSVAAPEGFPGTVDIVVSQNEAVLMYVAHAYLGQPATHLTRQLAGAAYQKLTNK